MKRSKNWHVKRQKCLYINLFGELSRGPADFRNYLRTLHYYLWFPISFKNKTRL